MSGVLTEHPPGEDGTDPRSIKDPVVGAVKMGVRVNGFLQDPVSTTLYS